MDYPVLNGQRFERWPPPEQPSIDLFGMQILVYWIIRKQFGKFWRQQKKLEDLFQILAADRRERLEQERRLAEQYQRDEKLRAAAIERHLNDIHKPIGGIIDYGVLRC